MDGSSGPHSASIASLPCFSKGGRGGNVSSVSEDEELATSGGAKSDDRGGFTGTSSGMRPEESQDSEP